MFFFPKKSRNRYLKLEISVACRNLENSRLKPFFSLHNIHLYLCWQVGNTKWILCCQKIGVNSAYLRFLTYKSYFVVIKLVWNVCIKAF